MVLLTVSDARIPVQGINVKGNTLSLTNVNMIYDYYNINTPQEIIQTKPNKFIEKRSSSTTTKVIELEFTTIPLSKDSLWEKFKELKEIKEDYETVKTESGTKFYKALADIKKKAVIRLSFLNYFKMDLGIYKLLEVNENNEKTVEGISMESSILYTPLPGITSKHYFIPHKDSIVDYDIEIAIGEETLELGELSKYYKMKEFGITGPRFSLSIESALNYYNKHFPNSLTSNKKYYMWYITKNRTQHEVFNSNPFTQINHYRFKILKYIKTYDPKTWAGVKDKSLTSAWHDKAILNYFNDDLLLKLTNVISTRTIIGPGYYTIKKIKDKSPNTFDVNFDTYEISFKKTGDDSLYIVRPVGSDKFYSHGELHDLLWSKDSNGRFPDILGKYKNINIHCNQINLDDSIFIKNNGDVMKNNLIGTINIKPSNESFYGVRNDYDNDRKIEFRLNSGCNTITRLDFWFSDNDGNRIIPKSSISLALAIN